MDLLPLLLLASALIPATPGVSLHISFQSLQKLDALASGKIESLGDATSYVRQSAALCGAADPASVPDGLESRLAMAELDAVRDPSKLVSDEQVASAFNFMSDEFGVQHPAHLTASDILQYRSVQASIFPHVFSPKTVSRSRPVGAIVMLYQLWYTGGVTEGVRKAAQLDRPAGSLKVTGGQTVAHIGVNRNSNAIGMEYRMAGGTYFARRSPERVLSFLKRLAEIMVRTEGGNP
jgi:hypothetical protein